MLIAYHALMRQNGLSWADARIVPSDQISVVSQASRALANLHQQAMSRS